VSKPTRSELVSAKGECDRCTARWDAKNAHGLAVQHEKKTGHPVTVEVTQRYHYGRSGNAKREEARLL
jgi:hypothetical protein